MPVGSDIGLEQKLKDIKAAALEEMAKAGSLEDLNEVRIRYLGKKGELTGVLRGMAALTSEERPRIGQAANLVRAEIEARLEESVARLKEGLRNQRLTQETIDITLPGTVFSAGKLHPLTTITRQVEDIFLGLGFTIADGPEVEMDYYNFEALNLPKDHPARDMQDTFFITPETLLRTQTSPVQVRTMERTAPSLPVKIIAPGRVYRRDDDATHSPMFHQIEGLVVDKRITFADLRGVLHVFAEKMFGPETKTRFRPSYFPFTEPSAEVDISCGMCGGQGCRVCSHTGWLEILGCGMVHPRVLEMSGYSSSEVTGFAFGMGVERITMLKYNLDDMRLLFDNDVRFLAQF
jgi:phenylalanyl-tRNA synthetase alpha chain